MAQEGGGGTSTKVHRSWSHSFQFSSMAGVHFFNLVPSLQFKEKINTGGKNSVFHT